MNNLYSHKLVYANHVFDTRFMETKALYLYHFNTLPNINFVNRIDGEKAFEAFHKKFGECILDVLTYRWYAHERKKFLLDKTVIILNNTCLVEFDKDYCEILHNGKQDGFVTEVTALLMNHKERQKRQPSEINLVVRDASGLQFKAMEIKKTKLDLGLFYENDFKEVDDIIQKRLKQKNDKGIILLHGLPGTGKTTYLRYLIGNQKKSAVLIAPCSG